MSRQSGGSSRGHGPRPQPAAAPRPGSEALESRLRTLTRLNQLVSSSLEPDEVLSGIAAAAAELMDVPVVSLWVVDVGEGDVGWVAAERRPLEVMDLLADPRTTNREWWQAHGFKSFLGVPIVFQDLLLGVLGFTGREPFHFGSDDRELLDVFVSQSASAIAKARLFQDIQDRRRLT